MTTDILSFLQESIRLKRMLRSGWVFSGVSLADVESVADHSHMVTLITLLQCLEEKKKGKEINLEKALIMALIHDLPESVSQDIDRCLQKFSPENYTDFKKDVDSNAIDYLLKRLPKESHNLLSEYFKELQLKESTEAKMVSEADRLETILQLKNYIQRGTPKENFKEFFLNFNKEKDNFEFDLIKALALELLKGD